MDKLSIKQRYIERGDEQTNRKRGQKKAKYKKEGEFSCDSLNVKNLNPT